MWKRWSGEIKFLFFIGAHHRPPNWINFRFIRSTFQQYGIYMSCTASFSKFRKWRALWNELSIHLKIKLGGAGATLATVLWSGTSSYCAMSSVAAPPRHPAPSISNTSVMYWMYSVPWWCARAWFRDSSRAKRFNVRERLRLVRESEV